MRWGKKTISIREHARRLTCTVIVIINKCVGYQMKYVSADSQQQKLLIDTYRLLLFIIYQWYLHINVLFTSSWCALYVAVAVLVQQCSFDCWVRIAVTAVVDQSWHTWYLGQCMPPQLPYTPPYLLYTHHSICSIHHLPALCTTLSALSHHLYLPYTPPQPTLYTTINALPISQVPWNVGTFRTISDIQQIPNRSR